MTTAIADNPLVSESRWLIDRCRTPRLRSMREFAETEIIIPDGPYQGRRYRCDRQPYTALFLDAVDSAAGNGWNRFVTTGPTQSGKTLTCFIIPLLYHLFEIGETVILGLPDMDMAGDKFREDIRPAIERSRYRELLPTRGGGSRGGRVESLQFKNGVTLKFMSGGGGDKSRAGFTSRVLIITETDGMDETGGTSREADKITQLEARTRAYGAQKRVYMECTVSVERGRTWREYQAGTESRIMLPCPHCGAWVAPEREHFVGWQDAQTVTEARAGGAFACPSCGKKWTDDQREAANLRSILVHRGQEIKGKPKSLPGRSFASGSLQPRSVRRRERHVSAPSLFGAPPATDTLGFRWSAVNNLFVSSADIAADEWKAAKATDEENADKEMCQFVWALPYKTPETELIVLDPQALTRRVASFPRGICPPDTEVLTIGLDLGKYLSHYSVIAWRECNKSHVVDYGRIEVASDQFAVEAALLAALREFRDVVDGGWGFNGAILVPHQVWIDSGWQPEVVYAFCRESGERWRPTKGHGAGQDRTIRYRRPRSKSGAVRLVGEGYHVSRLKTPPVDLFEIDADYWKTWVHQRLACPTDAPGAMTFFTAVAHEHLAFVKHLTAERRVEEFVAGKGMVTRWEQVRRNNHFLDAVSLACVAGHFCGVRLFEPREAPAEPQEMDEPAVMTMPDGRAFLATER